jgi:hypothetical protein
MNNLKFMAVAALAACSFVAITANSQDQVPDKLSPIQKKPAMTFAFETFMTGEARCIALVGNNNYDSKNLDPLTARHLAIVIDDAVNSTPDETLNSLRIACMQKLIAAGHKL